MYKLGKLILPLFALSVSPATQAGFYINGGAGGVFSHTKTSFTGDSTPILFSPTALGTSLFTLPQVNWRNRFKDGFDANLAAGYRFNPHWRADIEFVYQNIERASYGSYGWQEQNSITGNIYAQDYNNPISTVHRRAHIYSFLTNAAFDLPNHSPWTPFVSGGIGVAWLSSGRAQTTNLLTVDDPVTPLIETAHAHQTSPALYGTAFAWQFKLGVSHPFYNNSDLILQYRVFATSHFQATKSVITSNPETDIARSFYIGQHDIKGLLTQAIEINIRFNDSGAVWKK